MNQSFSPNEPEDVFSDIPSESHPNDKGETPAESPPKSSSEGKTGRADFPGNEAEPSKPVDEDENFFGEATLSRRQKFTIGIVLTLSLALLGGGAYFFYASLNNSFVTEKNTNSNRPLFNANQSAPLTNKILNANENLNADTDQDGLSDEEEERLGISPRLRDSDGDGLDDRSEVKDIGSDPSKIDTDGDGFSDGTEFENGYNPVGPGKRL